MLSRYFNGDIDGSGPDDLYHRTLDSVWGTQGPSGYGFGLFARSSVVSHTGRVEYATDWDPLGGGSAATCEVAGVDPVFPDDYVGRITYNLGLMNPGITKYLTFVYRRQ